MVVNFRARGISRGARKLAWTPTLIIKKGFQDKKFMKSSWFNRMVNQPIYHINKIKFKNEISPKKNIV